MSKINPKDQFVVNEQNINKIIANYEGLGELVDWSSPKNGIANTTLLLNLANREYVLKVYRNNRKSTLEILRELEYVDFLAQNQIPVVDIVKSSSSEDLVITKIENVEWRSVLMHKDKNAHPDATELPNNINLVANLARIQAKMHLLGLEFWQKRYPDLQPESDPFKNGIGRTVSELRIEIDLEIGMFKQFEKYFKQIQEFEFSYEPDLPAGFIHGDLDSTNFLASKEEVACILDFDDLRIEPFTACIATTLCELIWMDFSFETAKAYLNEYQKIRSILEVEKDYLIKNLKVVAYFFLLWESKIEKSVEQIQSVCDLIDKIEEFKTFLRSDSV